MLLEKKDQICHQKIYKKLKKSRFKSFILKITARKNVKKAKKNFKGAILNSL
jgi:hypothetical protein